MTVVPSTAVIVPVLTVKVSRLFPNLVDSFSELPSFVTEIEAWGAGQITLGEHPLSGSNWSHPGGRPMPTAIEPSIEPLTLLAAVSSLTTRLRLSTGAVLAPLRTPIILAKVASSLDALSGGRLDLGLAAGWFEAELLAAGASLADRFARLEESITVCRTLWTNEVSTFHGRWTTFDDLSMSPLPTKPIPIYIGGLPTSVTADRIARLGDGWIASEAASDVDIATGAALMRDAFLKSGRDPSSLAIRAALPPRDHLVASNDSAESLLARSREILKQYLLLGVTHVTLPLSNYASTREEAETLVRGLAKTIDALH